MTIRNFSITSAVLVTATLSLAVARADASGRITVAGEAKQTLTDVRGEALAAANEADQLRMAVETPSLSPDWHSVRLMALRDEINSMGHQIGILEAEHEALPAWEQQAIAKTLPLLRDAAKNTESAIQYLNNDRNRLWTPAYRAYADRVLQDSEKMSKTLGNYLKMDRLRAQEQRVDESLGLATGN